MLEQVKHYLDDRSKWVAAGKPVRSPEEIERIFNICEKNTCGYYEKKSEKTSKCNFCGCYLKKKSNSFNRISWSNLGCPLEEPLWLPEEPYLEEALNEPEPLEPPVEEVPAPPSPTRKCCRRH